ncbi:MAG: GLPGLI family protein [Bacteroides sp.]|nr:GLPGLI family protein [Bacteroides sp.]MBD5339814.1 GLPGLI family protein [Bacteroides sp.]
MNRLITSIIVCFVAIAAMAQNKADIEVSYTAMSPNFKNGKVDVKNQYVLLANAKESKFYSPITEYIDSLNSTPEGVAQWQEMTRGAYLSGNMDKIPRKDGSYYVVKSISDNILHYYDSAGLDKFVYEETSEEWTWEISDSTKNILGYECVKAKTDFHGRKWTVWFSPEIPLSNGPWKLGGLPGVILEASTDDDKYSFVAIGIQQTSKIIIPVYLADDYEKTDRKSFLKAKRAFLDNPLGSLNAQMGGEITISGNSGEPIFASSDVVDLIETDYK